MIYCLQMAVPAGSFHLFRNRLASLSIFHRIVIGNTVIIILGAIVGTLSTRRLTSMAADFWVIVLFATLGTSLSLLTNFWIIKTSLRPIHDLRRLVERLQAGQTSLDTRILAASDPDISQLAATLNSMVIQLEERNRQLHALSERVINVQEEERKRIALSLHDDTGQSLSSLIISLERLENRLPSDENVLVSRLASARKLASTTLEELRKIVFGLRPTILDDLGLAPAIRWYARSNLEPAGIQVSLEAPEGPLLLSPDLATALFRIAQEAINNIQRHSSAQTASIQLDLDGEQVCLVVEDDGQGFDPECTAENALILKHLGLLGIQERAQLAGGEAIIDSRIGRGTRLSVRIPLEK